MQEIRSLEKIDDSDKTAIRQRVCGAIYNNNIGLLKCLWGQNGAFVSFAWVPGLWRRSAPWVIGTGVRENVSVHGHAAS